MQEIQTKAIHTYEQNLQYLSQHEPELFRKIQLFDRNDLEIVPKYELEYKNGYFDVVELSSNLFLYNEDSNKYAKNVAKTIDYTKTSFLFEGIQDYQLTPETLQRVKKAQDDESIRLNDVLPIMYEAMKLAPKTTLIKHIDKFIFIGVGLGQHIIETDHKLNASEYLIIEENIELFRLSLFITPYYELAKKSTLHFSIAQNENEFLSTMVLFLEGTFYNNRYLKYFKFPPHSDAKTKIIQSALASQPHHVFPYGVQLEKYLRPLSRIANGFRTLNLSETFNEPIFNEHPVLILAAGPSLKKNIEWVKENQEKFIIIAVSSALKTLKANGVRPDIVTHIDGFDDVGNSCMPIFDGLDIRNDLPDTVFILGPYSPDALLKILPKEQVYLTQESTFYYAEAGSLSASCVGSLSTVLALHLGFKAIYLLGLDLAFDQTSGATHSGEHFLNATHDLENAEEVDYTISLRNTIVSTKGNFRNSVYTSPEFMSSIQTLCAFIPLFKREDQSIYNLNDGAFLAGTLTKEVGDIDTAPLVLLDKTQISHAIALICHKHSQIGMQNEDLTSMKKRLQIALTVKSIITHYQQKTYTNENQYMYDLLGIISDILKLKGREANNLATLFNSFFKYTIPYIMDIINTQKVTKIMTHIKKIDHELIVGMLNITERYIKEIEKFLKEIEK